LLQAEYVPVLIHLSPAIQLTDEQFFEFCQINRELRIERTAEGDVLIMPPAGGETGKRNADLIIAVGTWAKRDGSGVVFDSSTGFILPNGAVRSPDAAWVKRSRLAALTPEQKKKFLPMCPDFVIEIRSPTDHLATVKAKMREYLENGAQLGWLIDGEQRRVSVYRPHGEVECVDNPSQLSGDPVLPGFVLNVREIWEAAF
jgi:Uma2 family endonuclease